MTLRLFCRKYKKVMLRKITCFSIAVLAGFLYYSSAVKADIALVSTDINGLSLSYTPRNAHIDSIHTRGKIYSIFYYDNHTSAALPGTPLLPETSVFFAAPAGSVPAVELTGLKWAERTGVIIAPKPSLGEDSQGITVENYIEDTATYAMSGYRPGTYWNLDKSSTAGDLTLWKLTVRPLLFDAHNEKIALVDSFGVNVSFNSSSVAKTGTSIRLPDFIINGDVFSLAHGFQGQRKSAGTLFDPFSSGDWYRIKLSESGMYRIRGHELSQTDFPAGTVKSDHIRMYYGGGKTLARDPHSIDIDAFKEIAVKVEDNGDGIFDMNDSVIFYGSAISRFIPEQGSEHPVYRNHPYSEENVYWLTLSDEGTPKRIGSAGDPLSGTLDTQTTFPEILHIEMENHPEFEESGTEWYWDEISNSSKTYAFNTPGLAPSGTARVEVAFINLAVKSSHIVDIYINDDGPYKFQWNKGDFLKADFTLSKPLKSTGNLLRIVRTGGTTNEVIRLDWVDIEYSKQLKYDQNNFDFFVKGDGSPVKMSIAEVGKSSVELFDTTDPFNVLEIRDNTYDANGKKLTFQKTLPSGISSRFTISDYAYHLKVSSITKKNSPVVSLRNTANDADYIIISHNQFLDEARRLAAWRSRDSQVDPLTSMTVDAQDIYDEFGWGVFDPVSIRDFLKFAWENYNSPVRYCCLLGDAIWKYKNLDEEQKNRFLVPTIYHIDYHGNTATDDFYTWFDTPTLPYLAIGRMCANDIESAKILVDKTIDYESNPEKGLWHNRVLFVADDELGDKGIGSEMEFTNNTEILDTEGYVPRYLERTKIMQMEYPLKNLRKPDATEDLIKEINKGYLLINFIGHGNNELISHEHILEGSRDLERINNGSRQSLFVLFSCSVAHFDRIDNLSLGEMLHLREEGGCVAVIAAARETWNALNFDLNKSFYLNLFDKKQNPDHRIGEALKFSKVKSYTDSNANRYALMGDPATRLMIPQNSFAVADVDTVHRLEKLDLSGSVTDSSGPISYNGTLYIKAQGPLIHKTYTANGGRKVSYTLPGKTFYNGKVAVSGDTFNAELVIPKDLAPKKDDSKILFFCTGDTNEASGILEKFSIGGIYPGAADDVSGPDIIFSFDGKLFDDGDYIGRQPTLKATITDPSGINIYGNRGHNITLTIDDSEVEILTDSFQNINDYITGTLEYKCPILTSGEHTFELSVYDNYNNIAKKHVTASVVGSETGEIVIQNLLNYPNPMDDDGTTFTFNLNDEANRAEIKLFSQSGRFVNSISFSASYGYNTVFWKPDFSLANGVYFYKLTVRSLNGRKASKIEKLVVMR